MKHRSHIASGRTASPSVEANIRQFDGDDQLVGTQDNSSPQAQYFRLFA